MASGDTFGYSDADPIPTDGCAFRLIHLFRGEPNSTIHCELFNASIDASGPDMPYEALSYAWGGSVVSEHILLNNKNHLLTPNLHFALQNLRLEDEDRVLWIDAICINQLCNKEKNQQILQMASIYQHADKVIFFLGPSTYETDLLFSALTTLQREANRTMSKDWKAGDQRWLPLWCSIIPDPLLCPEYVLGLETVLDRPWFRRVWILQECAHAKRAVVVCGRRYVTAHIFALAPSLLQLVPQEHCQAVLDIMPGWPRDGWWARKRDLFSLLLRFQHSQASNPLDSVYALTSMATDANKAEFPGVDYGFSLGRVLDDVKGFLFPRSKRVKRARPGVSFFVFMQFIHNLRGLNEEEIELAIMLGDSLEVLRLMMRGEEIAPSVTAFDRIKLSIAERLLLPPQSNDTAIQQDVGITSVEDYQLELSRLRIGAPTKLDITNSDLEARTLIYIAVYKKHHDVLEKLLYYRRSCLGISDFKTLIFLACEKHDHSSCSLLVRATKFDLLLGTGGDVDPEDEWKILVAVTKLPLMITCNDETGLNLCRWALGRWHDDFVGRLFKAAEPPSDLNKEVDALIDK